MRWPEELPMPEVGCRPLRLQTRRTSRLWMEHPRMAQAAQGRELFGKKGIPCGVDVLRVPGHSWKNVRPLREHEVKWTYCLLKAALSFVWSQVHWDPDD